jgi:hypothetical protein
LEDDFFFPSFGPFVILPVSVSDTPQYFDPFSKVNSAMRTLYKKWFLCGYGKTLQEYGQKATQVVLAHEGTGMEKVAYFYRI